MNSRIFTVTFRSAESGYETSCSVELYGSDLDHELAPSYAALQAISHAPAGIDLEDADIYVRDRDGSSDLDWVRMEDSPLDHDLDWATRSVQFDG